MTDEQINAVIAETCGWTDTLIIDGMYGQTPVPNYCNDLNAMHEAEQYMWKREWNLRYDFVDELGKVLIPKLWQRINATDMLDATARQRAEAFLRTLGKWEDGK